MFLHLLHFACAIVVVPDALLPVFKLFRCLDFIFPMMVIVHITRNVKHPRSEVALSPEEVAVVQNAEEGVLHEVFAELLPFAKAIKEPIQRSFIAFKKQAHLVQVTFFDLHHQAVIGKRFQIQGLFKQGN